jgi:hypothetical protein
MKGGFVFEKGFAFYQSTLDLIRLDFVEPPSPNGEGYNKELSWEEFVFFR